MYKYDTNFTNIKEATRNFLDYSNVKIEEIGDGNLNFVFKVYDDKDCFALKHAKPYLKMLGKDFKLTTNRILAEMNSLEYFYTLCPSYVPKIHHKNEDEKLFVMDYLEDYVPLREKHEDINSYKQLGEFVFELAKNKPVKELYYECEELKEITKNYVFEYPFIENHDALTILDYFPQKKFSNKFLKNLEYLKDVFLNSNESLIHGDLHTDSIMIKDKNIAIIDSEFSLFSEISFDIGNILAHTIFSSISLKNINYKKKILSLFQTLERLDNFEYILKNSIGFCAIEMARRLYVPAKSKDLENIQDMDEKIKAYELSFEISDYLGANINEFDSAKSFIKKLEKWL